MPPHPAAKHRKHGIVTTYKVKTSEQRYVSGPNMPDFTCLEFILAYLTGVKNKSLNKVFHDCIASGVISLLFSFIKLLSKIERTTE